MNKVRGELRVTLNLTEEKLDETIDILNRMDNLDRNKSNGKFLFYLPDIFFDKKGYIPESIGDARKEFPTFYKLVNAGLIMEELHFRYSYRISREGRNLYQLLNPTEEMDSNKPAFVGNEDWPFGRF